MPLRPRYKRLLPFLMPHRPNSLSHNLCLCRNQKRPTELHLKFLTNE
jgi:hypothetical protein